MSEPAPPILPEGAAEGDSNNTPPPPSPSPPDRPSIDIEVTPSPSLRRSTRHRTAPDYYSPTAMRFFDPGYTTYLSDFAQVSIHDAFLIYTDMNSATGSMATQNETLAIIATDDDDPVIQHWSHPFAFSAKANSLDTPNFNEAMNGPDREGFKQAMDSELEQLEAMNVWKKVPRSKALKNHRTIIACTWAFRRKRYPDGAVKKLKARLCARGDQQVDGVDYFDTFSRVEQWSTIRLMLIISILLDLRTVQVDYTLAFVHAPLPEDTYYIEMPKLYEEDGMILELKRNLYGLCDAPKNFYYHLKKGLEQRGLKASDHDHCLFLSDNLIVLTYVDDCILFSRDSKEIDKLIH